MKKGKSILFLAILLLGIGFAAVSTTLYLNGDINISANSEDFDVKFTRSVIDNEDKTSESISVDGKTINFTTKELKVLNDKSVLNFEVTNSSSLYDAEVSIECTSGEKSEYYQITKEVTNLVSAKTTESGKVEVQKIKMVEEDIEETFTCTLTAKAVERTTKGEEPVKINENIVNSDIECLKNREAGSCAPGTEIKYMVNDATEKTFNVLHDDGVTMTLQQKENTISKEWNIDKGSGSQAKDGPESLLISLENSTNNWENVNTIDYALGTTLFENNYYTGCDDSLICSENIYTLDKRIAKARMISVQEATALGCTSTENSCPSWMLYGLSECSYPTCTSGIANSWTMNGKLGSYSSYIAWTVNYKGKLVGNAIYNRGVVKAVVEINK